MHFHDCAGLECLLVGFYRRTIPENLPSSLSPEMAVSRCVRLEQNYYKPVLL